MAREEIMGARSAAIMHVGKENKGITGNKYNNRHNKPKSDHYSDFPPAASQTSKC